MSDDNNSENDSVLDTHDTKISVAVEQTKTVENNTDRKDDITTENKNEIPNNKFLSDISTVELSKLSNDEIKKYFLDRYQELNKKLNKIEKKIQKKNKKNNTKINESEDNINTISNNDINYDCNFNFGIKFNMYTFIVTLFVLSVIFLLVSIIKLLKQNKNFHRSLFLVFVSSIMLTIYFDNSLSDPSEILMIFFCGILDDNL